jgi:hypothetical protein
MCLWWAGFPIFTAPMHGSCVTSVVLISALRAVSGCRACISCMLPIFLLPGMPVQDCASVGADADLTVFYIAVMGFSGLHFQSV